MTQTSTMFLNELTILDHAYISSDGIVIGGSFNPSFLVTGKIDPVEQVVVDFSTIKKRIKQYIDDDVNGFDHKCWIIENFSHFMVHIDGEIEHDFSKLASNEIDPETEIEIHTSTSIMVAPKNAFKFIPTIAKHENYSIDNVGMWLDTYLNNIFKDENIQVECTNTIKAHTHMPEETNPIALFTYVHGLKDSTSWGCQNLAHGHLSYLQVDSDATPEKQKEVLTQIAKDLDYSTFVNRNNIDRDTEKELAISYDTKRGHFEASYKKNQRFDRRRKLKVLDTETTVEYLAEYIKNTYAGTLQSINARGLFVSEGLSKGAYIKL